LLLGVMRLYLGIHLRNGVPGRIGSDTVFQEIQPKVPLQVISFGSHSACSKHGCEIKGHHVWGRFGEWALLDCFYCIALSLNCNVFLRYGCVRGRAVLEWRAGAIHRTGSDRKNNGGAHGFKRVGCSSIALSNVYHPARGNICRS
jgi:hypothetical protein